MTNRRSTWMGLLVATGVAALFTAAAVQNASTQSRGAADARPQPAMPQYDSGGALQLPGDYRQWIFIGSSLGLSYGEGQQGMNMEMFHETLMEPTAYKHFVATGSFREGTMLALILHGTGESVLPARRGKFAADVHGVEMAVKDTAHRPEGWAYYNFGGMAGLRTTAQAMPKESCHNCHAQHARRDNVFLQFYPLLAEAARLSVATASPEVPRESGRANVAPVLSEPRVEGTPLALNGLDPVLLTGGREEMGKPEIVAAHGPYRYQFVSEPNRARFAADPGRYAIQNSTCPVVPGAPVDPSLFAVHETRIYAFATSGCVDAFKAAPADYVKR